MDDTDQKEKSNSVQDVTTPNERRRLKLSTPDSTQRELKKLEDYWTRNNPVIGDSPRLRSKRKVNFDTEEKIMNTNNKRNLPDSPVCFSEERNKSDHLIATAPKEPDFITNIVPTHSESHDTDTSDSDDEDYIPPRKKLRSEITKEELWEGIPLTVTFKRLAPISKRYSECSNVDVFTEHSLVLEKRMESKVVESSDQDHTGESSCKIIEHIDSVDLNQRANVEHQIRFNSIPIDHFKDDLKQDIEEECDTQQNIQPSSVLERNETLSQILIPDSEGIEEDAKRIYLTEEEQREPVTSSDPCSSTSSLNEANDFKKEEFCKQSSGSEDLHRQYDNKGLKAGSTPIRRSRRLSENERRKSEQNTPNVKIRVKYHFVAEELEPKIMDSKSRPVENSGKDDHTKVSCNPKLTFGPIKSNKHHKKIPPLRIRLKQAGSVKKKCSNALRKGSNIEMPGTSNACGQIDLHSLDDKEKIVHKHIGKRKDTDKFSGSQKQTVKLVNNKRAANVTDNDNSADNQHNKHNVDKKDNSNLKSTELTEKSVDKSKEKKKKQLEKTQRFDKKKSSQNENPDKKITSENNSTNRSPSPGTSNTIELRLNNVRRISAASELLSNSLLNKHACVLWSSENRRHVQLSNPNSSLTDLDAILIKKWDNLSEREKIRYFQRARDALKEENRHSNRRNYDKKDEPTNTSTGNGMGMFQALSPASQMTEIKKWLNLYHGISPQHCAQVISSFKSCLNEENLERDSRQQDKNKPKTKSKKSKREKRTNKQGAVLDSYSRYRKLLYGKILDNKETFADLLVEQKKAHGQQLIDDFSALIRRLISGEVVHFAGDIKSDKLTETLYDLRALERENRISVTGDNQQDEDFMEILQSLRYERSVEENLLSSLEQNNVNFQSVEQICQQVTAIPTLSPSVVSAHLTDKSKHEDINMLAPRPQHPDNSPVTLLTDWVADDILTKQPKICFRRAVSLLSNKVVPSPTLVMEQRVNGACCGPNKNDCNVVFTQIKNTPQNV